MAVKRGESTVYTSPSHWSVVNPSALQRDPPEKTQAFHPIS